MSTIIPNILNQVSTTSGFIMFCTVIAVSYGCIWFLFLFESKPKKKIQSEAAGKEEGKGEKEEGKQSKPSKQPQKGAKKPEKQPA